MVCYGAACAPGPWTSATPDLSQSSVQAEAPNPAAMIALQMACSPTAPIVSFQPLIHTPSLLIVPSWREWIESSSFRFLWRVMPQPNVVESATLKKHVISVPRLYKGGPFATHHSSIPQLPSPRNPTQKTPMSQNQQHQVTITGVPRNPQDPQATPPPRLDIRTLVKDERQFSLYVQAIRECLAFRTPLARARCADIVVC